MHAAICFKLLLGFFVIGIRDKSQLKEVHIAFCVVSKADDVVFDRVYSLCRVWNGDEAFRRITPRTTHSPQLQFLITITLQDKPADRISMRIRKAVSFDLRDSSLIQRSFITLRGRLVPVGFSFDTFAVFEAEDYSDEVASLGGAGFCELELAVGFGFYYADVVWLDVWLSGRPVSFTDQLAVVGFFSERGGYW